MHDHGRGGDKPDCNESVQLGSEISARANGKGIVSAPVQQRKAIAGRCPESARWGVGTGEPEVTPHYEKGLRRRGRVLPAIPCVGPHSAEA